MKHWHDTHQQSLWHLGKRPLDFGTNGHQWGSACSGIPLDLQMCWGCPASHSGYSGYCSCRDTACPRSWQRYPGTGMEGPGQETLTSLSDSGDHLKSCPLMEPLCPARWSFRSQDCGRCGDSGAPWWWILQDPPRPRKDWDKHSGSSGNHLLGTDSNSITHNRNREQKIWKTDLVVIKY